jgi:hypothetical protein
LSLPILLETITPTNINPQITNKHISPRKDNLPSRSPKIHAAVQQQTDLTIETSFSVVHCITIRGLSL